jgi:putative hydrolase of the HAD superfamily
LGTSPSAVIFDLGGVVFDSPLALIGEYERRHGLPPFFIARLVGGYGMADGAWHRLERGELPIADFCREFDALIAAEGHSVTTAELMRDLAERSAVRPVMLAAIRKLRDAGLKVAALTNNWVTDERHDERLSPVREAFHVFVESCKVGLRKPDPRIYELACKELDVEPASAVFLDDIGSNLKAAKGLGMTTVKVDDPVAALGELGKILGLALV